jgi:hypothetical protein
MGNVQYSLSQLLSAPGPQRGCSAMEACKKKKKSRKRLSHLENEIVERNHNVIRRA